MGKTSIMQGTFQRSIGHGYFMRNQYLDWFYFSPVRTVAVLHYQCSEYLYCTYVHVILQVTWLNDYHQKCRDVIGQELKNQGKTEVLDWLMKETQPIG